MASKINDGKHLSDKLEVLKASLHGVRSNIDQIRTRSSQSPHSNTTETVSG